MYSEIIKPILDKFLKQNKINEQSTIKCIGTAPYHQHTRISIPGYGHFCIRGIESGCGGAIIYGYTSLIKIDDILIEAVKLIFECYKKYGLSTIITTLGQRYKDDFLIKTGFVKISTYSNYTHAIDGSYKQTLYQIIL